MTHHTRPARNTQIHGVTFECSGVGDEGVIFILFTAVGGLHGQYKKSGEISTLKSSDSSEV